MKRRRISTVEEADAAMERLAWLKTMGSPNREVRDLWDAAVAYRAAVHRQEQGEERGKWAKRV